MNLEIKNIYSDDVPPPRLPDDVYDFNVAFRVEIGEKGSERGEIFHFVAASPLGLRRGAREGEFLFLRGYILMARFDWKVVRRAVENIVDHARGYRTTWGEVIEFFSRYGRYDSENRHS